MNRTRIILLSQNIYTHIPFTQILSLKEGKLLEENGDLLPNTNHLFDCRPKASLLCVLIIISDTENTLRMDSTPQMHKLRSHRILLLDAIRG
jgi:hypothetical protein